MNEAIYRLAVFAENDILKRGKRGNALNPTDYTGGRNQKMFEKRLIVLPEQAFGTKEEVLHYLTHLENDRVQDADGYEKDIREREATFATYVTV